MVIETVSYLNEDRQIFEKKQKRVQKWITHIQGLDLQQKHQENSVRK